jgi:transposase
LFINKGQRSFALLPLSHFKCIKAEFGMSNLQDIKLDFSNLHTGSKSIHVSSIRTDGVQCSVVLSHKLEGIYERNKAEKEVKKRFKIKEQKDKEKRKREQRPINFNKDYIVGVDPGIVNIITCFEGDENHCSLTDKAGEKREKVVTGR